VKKEGKNISYQIAELVVRNSGILRLQKKQTGLLRHWFFKQQSEK